MLRRILVIVTIVAIGFGLWRVVDARDNQQTQQPSSARAAAAFNKKKLSLDDPTSLWVVVNKKRPLNPKNYIPSDLRIPNLALRSTSTSEEMKLRDPAATALEKMFAGAKEQGINLLLASGYRSFNLQTGVYNRYVSTQGQATADSQSARPGYSEHQTGLAVDVGAANRSCEIESCFSTTPEGKWVAANAHTYGFIVRYQDGAEGTVGYIYEPWHLRFVGTELSEELHRLGNPTLEDFFGLPAAADY